MPSSKIKPLNDYPILWHSTLASIGAYAQAHPQGEVHYVIKMFEPEALAQAKTFRRKLYTFLAAAREQPGRWPPGLRQLLLDGRIGVRWQQFGPRGQIEVALALHAPPMEFEVLPGRT